ncbi:antigen 5 like allergen Cul n 1-like [Armigeres subalbatus]|uniref:antigen 5 like allergen Cul n 1-like n=1 Tax=Armigeres subalbatus TaxID=124917 RepID=UPI002ED57AA4
MDALDQLAYLKTNNHFRINRVRKFSLVNIRQTTMEFIISVVLAVVVGLCDGQTTNYCDTSLCPNGGPHIACNGLTTLSSTCGAGSFEVTMNSTNQQLIVGLHNQLRSKVASGQQVNRTGTYFKQAAKMATLQWDTELANIAAANARRCVYGHDKCRNTATMKYVGQNIAYQAYYGMSFTDNQLLSGFINSWFSEAENTTTQYLASYPSNYNGPAIGHFTQIVSDRTSKVGCSMVSYVRSPFTYKYFVCNYGLTNIVNQPVYAAGNACSGCTTGCNANYPGLCSTAEVVKNNP